MPAEHTMKEALTQIETFEMKVRKLRGKDGLFRVWNPENKADLHIVNLNAKTCTCDKFKNNGFKCKHIEFAEKTDEARRQRDYERINRWRRARYHSDPEFRRKYLEAGRKSARKQYEKLCEDYRSFKLVLGGKCTICGNSDPDVLLPHHPDGRNERFNDFKHSNEFRNWRKYGIMPNVLLMCQNCHQKTHLAKIRAEGTGSK